MQRRNVIVVKQCVGFGDVLAGWRVYAVPRAKGGTGQFAALDRFLGVQYGTQNVVGYP